MRIIPSYYHSFESNLLFSSFLRVLMSTPIQVWIDRYLSCSKLCDSSVCGITSFFSSGKLYPLSFPKFSLYSFCCFLLKFEKKKKPKISILLSSLSLNFFYPIILSLLIFYVMPLDLLSKAWVFIFICIEFFLMSDFIYLLLLEHLIFDWTQTQKLSERTASVSSQSVPAVFLWLPSFSWPKVQYILQPLLYFSQYAVSSEQFRPRLCCRNRGVSTH